MCKKKPQILPFFWTFLITLALQFHPDLQSRFSPILPHPIYRTLSSLLLSDTVFTFPSLTRGSAQKLNPVIFSPQCPYGQVNVKDPAKRKLFNSLFYL